MKLWLMGILSNMGAVEVASAQMAVEAQKDELRQVWALGIVGGFLLQVVLFNPAWNEQQKHLKMDGWNTSFFLAWYV